MQNEPMLCVQDLSVRFKTKYGSAAAVNHVSFSLKKGEKLGLVGESGSGKSVTSKSIIRLLPTPPAQITGSIRLNGEELLTKTERQMCRVRGNQISMIFQELCLVPDMSVAENIFIGREPKIGKTGIVDRKKLIRQTAAVFNQALR